jgi:hypothetical protein
MKQKNLTFSIATESDWEPVTGVTLEKTDIDT